MRKLDILEIGFMVYSFMIVGLVIFPTSCQPPPDPLKNAEFPCFVIKKGFAHRIWIDCQDKPYSFADKGYSEAFKEKDTINEPLNK